MEVNPVILLIMSGVELFLCLFAMAKNSATYSVRSWAFAQNDHLHTYKALPSYDEMFGHHRHWHRFTIKQWKAWLATQRREAHIREMLTPSINQGA